MNTFEPMPKRISVPRWCFAKSRYSPARSKMMIWSSGLLSIVPSHSCLTKKLLPAPVFPDMKPTGEASDLRSQITRLFEDLFCPQ